MAQTRPSTVPVPHAPVPINDALSRDFPDLANWSKEELQALLVDDAYLDAYANTLPAALAMHGAVEAKLAENLALAQTNEAMRPALDALRGDTARLFAEANELKAHWAQLEAAQAEDFKRFDPAIQLNRLRSATSTQASLLESLVRSFLEGGMEEDMFSSQYVALAKTYHRRAIMLDKWEAGAVEWRA